VRDFNLFRFRLISAAIFSLVAFQLTQAPAGSVRAADASFLDVIVLGNNASEQSHGFHDERSQIIKGGLDESARRLLPDDPVSFDGGSISFSLKVDPSLQNYVTVKLWGSDKGAGLGRLLLFADGLQVGYRREGDYDVLNQADAEGECPGRFLYQTIPLPPLLTRGKTSIELKIAALGPMWYYGTTFAQYQKNLEEPTRGIYRVYTHTTTRFVPDPSEKQGVFQSLGIRPGPGEEVIEQSREIVNERLSKLLEKTATDKPSNNLQTRFSRMLLLSEAYNTPWSAAYLDERAIKQIIIDADNTARDVASNPKFISNDWLGTGPMGEAVTRVWPAIKERMGEKIEVGSTIKITRGQAWANALRQSVDFWRTHRRAYTNQSMIVDRNIYTANRGLELIDPSRALPESQTLRYLYEAVGIEPWLGSDPSENQQPPAAETASLDDKIPKPFGEHYYLVTRKGLSRELGWVGTYGETILHFTHDIVQLTGDAKIRDQLRNLEAARMFFRYPGVDGDGYQCMKLASEIDNRTAHYPLSGAAYTAPNIREDWWMDVPALLNDDPVAVGAAQQSVADNQYFAYVQSRLKDPDTLGMMRNIDEYAKFKTLSPSSYHLPMGDKQPDFVFSDEEDAVLAIKHGNTRLFVNLYYRAERGVNGVARVFELDPAMTRIATVRTEFETSPSGHTYTRPDWIDGIRSKGLPPPDEVLHEAWAGDTMPITARPPGAPSPAYGDWGPFLGKASFYRLRYGDYLIAVNTTYENTFTIAVPADAPASARDLVDDQRVSPGEKLTLGPCSTIVLYLGD